MKKAILINVKEKTITEVEVGEGIQDIYKHLECQTFDVVGFGDDADCYVDDEGLMKNAFIDMDGIKHNMHGFSPAPNSVIIGNGLVLGVDHETGESTNSPLTIEQVEKMVTFVEYDNPEDRPQPFVHVTSWDF